MHPIHIEQSVASMDKLIDKLKNWFTPVFSEIIAKKLLKYDTGIADILFCTFVPGSIEGTIEYKDVDGKTHSYRLNLNPIA